MILSIDTSTKYFSAAVSDVGGNLLNQIIIEANGKHSELLFDNLKLLIEKTDLKFENLIKIATTTGPGSFTGIRIGLAFALTVAQVCNIPIVGVSTLELLAYQVLFNEQNLPENFFICPMICSIQNEVYTSIYIAMREKSNEKNKLRRISNYTALDINDIKYLFDKLQLHYRSYPHSLQILFVGDGAAKHSNTIKKTFSTKAHITSEKNCIPNASALIKISLLKKSTNPKNIKPIYIKPPRIHRLSSVTSLPLTKKIFP
ncbi:MAG: tRNA (adenosine(37)-N6)-threonylcarbamoyltransferase complex dimerization subunit type 1 TsaB [Elusimicrobiota bacterium]|nr:tRNA (adenosine(37)-N6)-threonylcarbamoyltransferase complex dimerization subunit type 1 TsaB [Elusimicrobiota bacterium]